MRITFLSPVGVVGGAERVLLAAIRGARERLPAARLGVVLLADGPLRAEAERLGAAVTVVPLPACLARLGDTRLRGRGRAHTLARVGWFALGAAPAAVGFVRRLQAALHRPAPDLIHSNGLKAHALAALARPRGVPVLWHLHDFLSHHPVMAPLLRRLAVGVDGGIAISDMMRRDAEAVLPGLAISVVRNAVDTDHFAPADRDGAELDRLAGLPPAGPGVVRVGLVATYADWKGQDVFLDALARLPAPGPPVRGYVVGGPIYATAGSQFTRDELERQAAANGLAGRVGFVPFRPDPADVYRSLDVAVHASTRPEPFGLTIAEAMGCGKPVVVAAAGGAAELFTPGHDGFGHAPGDAAGLADAIARLAADPGLRAWLGANARRTAVERFSQERYGREIAAVYAACRRDWTGPGSGRGER
ncbi:MAG: glycosyltransferase family 4 protein [Planctomycetaceae bacterium]|nr:glycosyltransferase family 4 protein [Planctomycetaceae bacterium]